MVRVRERVAVVLGATLVACYAPTPHPGAPCTDGVCPTGLVCSPATNTCERSAVDPPDDAAILLDSAVEIDGALIVPPDARACFGAGLLDICLATPPSAPLQIASTTTIDTQSSPMCVAYTGTNPGAYCVITGTSVSIAAGATLRATGGKPLVILSTGTATIDGTVDVGAGGAGANPSVCVAGGTPGASEGGPGGSFSGVGGSGGGKVTGLGPAGAAAVTTPAVRGGCRGGNGNGATPGTGGAGGGAVYVIAASTLTIDGTIDAAGAPGTGAAVAGGGGGGGAGGFIGLDAPTVTIAAAGSVFANGGGGGEGATPHSGGLDGARSASPTVAGSGGGDNAPHGGDGGAGSVGGSRAGTPGSAGGSCGQNASAGGGGGGGAGMIYVFPVQTLGGQVSPPRS